VLKKECKEPNRESKELQKGYEELNKERVKSYREVGRSKKERVNNSKTGRI
jgi:hypothetical protein